MFSPRWLCFLFFQFFCAFAATAPTSSTTDTLNPTESITDGQIVVSTGSSFALGFFSPGTSRYRYVGIWYYQIPETTVVWVANRDNPINDSSGVLSLDGNLVVTSHSDWSHPLWSTNVSISSNTTVLQLLNTGNLVLYSGGDRNRILWQSFDHPTHMWLPGVKLGLDRRTGLNRILTSWRSEDDPGLGIYSFGVDPQGSPQFFLYKGSAPLWRSGPWNGRAMSGVPQMTQGYIFRYDFVNTTDELYTIYFIYNSSIFSTCLLDDSGSVQRRTWVGVNRRWNTFWSPLHGDDVNMHYSSSLI